MVAANDDLSVFAQDVPSVPAIDLETKWWLLDLKLFPLELMKFFKVIGSYSFFDILTFLVFCKIGVT
jgi:hypothetical protein